MRSARGLCTEGIAKPPRFSCACGTPSPPRGLAPIMELGLVLGCLIVGWLAGLVGGWVVHI